MTHRTIVILLLTLYIYKGKQCLSSNIVVHRDLHGYSSKVSSLLCICIKHSTLDQILIFNIVYTNACWSAYQRSHMIKYADDSLSEEEFKQGNVVVDFVYWCSFHLLKAMDKCTIWVFGYNARWQDVSICLSVCLSCDISKYHTLSKKFMYYHVVMKLVIYTPVEIWHSTMYTYT